MKPSPVIRIEGNWRAGPDHPMDELLSRSPTRMPFRRRGQQRRPLPLRRRDELPLPVRNSAGPIGSKKMNGPTICHWTEGKARRTPNPPGSRARGMMTVSMASPRGMVGSRSGDQLMGGLLWLGQYRSLRRGCTRCRHTGMVRGRSEVSSQSLQHIRKSKKLQCRILKSEVRGS